MNETLKMMKTIITGKEKEKSVDDLIKDYQNSLNPSILAYFYIQNYGLILKISNKETYKQIDNDDKVSYCLQSLDKSLQTYDFNNKSFTSYFTTIFQNLLRTHNITNHYNNRKANLYKCSLDEIDELGIYEDDYLDLDNYNLSSEEKEQCRLLVDGYTIKDISNMFKVSVQCVYQRNKKIRNKLLNIV